MSRETNSLLLRYGLNKFWSSSLSVSKFSYINNIYENIVNFVLFNNFLQPLKIQYNINFLNVFIFYLKQDKLTFLDKYLKIEKFSLTKITSRIKYGLFLKIPSTEVKPKSISNKLFFSLVTFLAIKKLFLVFKHKLLGTDVNFLFYVQTKKYLLNKLYQKFVKKTKITFLWFYKLKHINQIIKFRILGVLISLIIYFYTNKKLKINLKSILEKNDGLLRVPFIVKYKQNHLMIQKLFIILISFIFLKASILNNYINMIIKKTKNKKHIKNLVLLFSNIKILFEKQFVPLLGLKFKISGRLNGKLRKANYGYKLGSLRLLSLYVNLDYSCYSVYTQYGSFSLKLWLGNKVSLLS